jgi:hypothetical protein
MSLSNRSSFTRIICNTRERFYTGTTDVILAFQRNVRIVGAISVQTKDFVVKSHISDYHPIHFSAVVYCLISCFSLLFSSTLIVHVWKCTLLVQS